MNLIDLAEREFVPDKLIRYGVRRLLRKRLKATANADLSEVAASLRESPVALATDEANEQHYEVPPDFFQFVLGKRLKYSSGLYPAPDSSLATAEDEMLRLTAGRAEIEDGMRILELGCGWGSLTCWLAEHYPSCEITAVSNSASQRCFIEARTASVGLRNIQVVTADMRSFDTAQQHDRVISIEMLEHMRNYELLFRRVSSWLTPEGKAFIHVFCHRDKPYLFEPEGADNWMARNFFTGGTMPSEKLFGEFADDLRIQKQWRVDGLHYWRTCEAWLRNLDRNRNAILERFREDLSDRDSKRNLQRWRIFLMACAELFRFRNGTEWFVAHYLFEQTRTIRAGSRSEHEKSYSNARLQRRPSGA